MNQQRTEYFVVTQLINFASDKKSSGQIEDKYAEKVIAELHVKKAYLKVKSPAIAKLDL